MDKEELWQSALAEIELSISRANFITWFKNTSIISKKNGVVVLAVPNTFTKEWLEKKYNRLVLKSLRNITSDTKDIKFIIKPQEELAIREKKTKKKEVDTAALENQLNFAEVDTDKETNLNPKYTFESFVVGSSNELAHAASVSVSENLGKTYNPLFIYGGVGLGKTHLLQAVGNYIKTNNPQKKIKYVSSEKFTRDLVSAISKKGTEEFKNDYRKVDLLILDDVQFISGKEKTQEEFFHTFNDLHGRNKQIVLSSDRPPKAIPTLEERLRSRFEGGMIADISAPDYETRLAILKTKVEEKSYGVDDEILGVIANTVSSNIRELEGALNKVVATTHLTGKTPSVERVRSLLSLNQKSKAKINTKNIIRIVSSFYDVKEEDLINKSRKREIVRPRQICMYLIRRELKNSYPYIGEKFGGRDHTTVMHACNKIEKEIKNNENFNEEIDLIKSRLFN